MARKHFEEYLSTITAQYRDLQETLAEMSKEVDEGMIEPERIEQLKATIAPVKNSFDTLLYIKYLLDKPVKPAKHKKYDRTNQKVINSTLHVSKATVVENNNKVIASLTNCINKYGEWYERAIE